MTRAGIYDGEMTVKRLRVTRAGVVPSAENHKHPDIEVAKLPEPHIWGVVTRSLHCVLRA